MRIQKIIGMTTLCMAISGLVMAQAPAVTPGGPPQQAVGAGAAKLDMTPVYEAMDANKDGMINKEEWLASGMTQDSYDNLFVKMLDKDQDGYLTKEDILAAIPRFDVDIDKDGKASMKEFADANKKAAESMKSGGQGGTQVGAPPQQ